MRERRRMMALGLAGLFALATSGVSLARAQDNAPRPAGGQDDPARATRAQQDSDRSGGNSRAQDAEPQAARNQTDVSHGTYMLIAHGLGMAIEASSLQALADQPGAAEGAGGRPDAAGQLRQHARAAFAASDRLFRVASQEIGQAARSGRESGDDRGQANEASRGAASAPDQNDRAPADANRRGAAGAQAGGVRLSGSPTERFSTAANEYASTLRRFAPEAAQAGGGRGAEAANRAREADGASVALINHAVCEVLDAFKLRHMIQVSGSASAESRALLQHAQQMDAEGRQALRQFAVAPGGGGAERPEASDATGQPAGAADRQSGQFQGAVQTLARQAHEIVRAIDDLGQEARVEHGSDREGQAAGAEDRRGPTSPATTAPGREDRDQNREDRPRPE